MLEAFVLFFFIDPGDVSFLSSVSSSPSRTESAPYFSFRGRLSFVLPRTSSFSLCFCVAGCKSSFFFSVSAAKANKLQPHRTAVYFPFFLFGFFFTTTIILLWAFLRDNITVLPKQNFSGCFQNIHKQISSFFFLQKKTTVWLKLFFFSQLSPPSC